MKLRFSQLIILVFPLMIACNLFTQFSAESDMPNANVADADVTFVRTIQATDGSWTFHVTVSHPDTGWEDYADGWDVITLEGEVLSPDASSGFTRLLLHPHVGEQPFTRSQSNIIIPEGVTQVIVRAHDIVDGWGGQEITVDLTMTSGDGFEVESNSN